MKQRLYNWIYRTLRSMGIRETAQITLRDLYDAVGKEAKEHGQDYYAAYAEMHSKGGVKLKGYYHGNSHIEGKTIEEVITNMRDYRKPAPESPIKDIVL